MKIEMPVGHMASYSPNKGSSPLYTEEQVQQIVNTANKAIEEREVLMEAFWDCIHDAESIYDKYFALLRETSSEPVAKENYFKCHKEILRNISTIKGEETE